MSNRLRAVIFLTVVGLLWSPAQVPASLFTSDTTLIVLPFRDESGFTGKWNLAMDMPRFFAAYAKERFRVGIISPVSVRQYAAEQGIDTARMNTLSVIQKVSERFRTRYVVAATITALSINRFTVSEVQLAGYEAFSAEVRLRYFVYDAARFGTSRDPLIYEGEAEGSVKDRGLGMTLFGKQTERTNQYFALDEVTFGSELFNKTIIGEALFECMDDLSGKLERMIPSLVSKSVVLSSEAVIDSARNDSTIILKRILINGDIVIVDGSDVFINLGSKDGLSIGEILPVYAGSVPITDPKTGELLGSREEKIGEVQIIEIRAEHLSLATIVQGKGTIVPKQRVRKVIVR